MCLKKNSSISIKNANVYSLLFLIIIIVSVAIIILKWEINWTKEYVISNFVTYNMLIMYFLLVISIPIHECIHAFMFWIFSRDVNNYK